jgi:ABC-type Na+ efflux pump permease subunit
MTRAGGIAGASVVVGAVHIVALLAFVLFATFATAVSFLRGAIVRRKREPETLLKMLKWIAVDA